MPFAPGTSALEPTSILVVDDEPLLRNVVCTLLGREGYVCGQASGVREALAILDREPYGLVLCDLEMPGERGIDLVKALHPRMPHVAVVIVSGRNDMSIITDCLEQGAYGYVFKPFQVREILVQIRGALRRQRLELDAQDREGELNRRVLEQTKVIRESREEVALRLMSAAGFRDQETGMHVRRIGLYAAAMAALLGWDEEAIESIRLAAPMHDIGKIGVPDAVLQKHGPLDDAEWVVMRRHPNIGAAMLKGSNVPFMQMAARIAACHHEKWDGTGYPRGLRAEQIPIEARITTIADVFDALSNIRHYKPAWDDGKVVAELEACRGGHFDPELVDIFLRHIGLFRTILDENPDTDNHLAIDAPEPAAAP
jgi:putative two-component system response regulator